MFFRKTKAEWNVLNDKDNNIVNLYMCVLHKLDELVEILNYLPKSRKLFLDFKVEVQDKREIEIPDPMRAAQSREKIGGSTIENLDFEELIDKYNPRINDFWYLDPPYFVAHEKGNKYYQHNFKAEDHLRLKEKVDKIHEQGGKFMISYDYREEVKELYKNYDVRTINLKYAGATDEAKQKERKEYLIINYKPSNQVGLF